MFQAILSLALAAVMHGGQLPDKLLTGFVLITTDEKPYQRWTGEVNLENLRMKFPEEDYTVVEDDEHGVLTVFTVIDHDVPIIAEELRWLGLAQAFSSVSDPSSPQRIGDMDEAGRKWVEETIATSDPPRFWQDGFKLDDAAVALRPGISVSVRTDGQWHYVRMHAQSDDVEKARNRGLASSPVRVKPTSQIRAELAREAETVTDPPPRDEPAPTLYAYRTYDRKSDAYITATKALKKLQSDLQARVREGISSLRAAMDLSELEGFGGAVPNGEVDLDRLPADHRMRIERGFIRSWRVFGFASESEARTAFSQVSSVTYNFEMTLAWAHGDGNPDNLPRRLTGVIFYRGR